MALSVLTIWNVRTDGSDDNGGGFKRGATGTDYSLQAAAQVTYTDLVIDGADSAKITSAGTPFTSAHVGNIINITSGTGFTVQRAQVVSVASSVASMDKSMGTVGSTGGNGKLGGAMLTIGATVTATAEGGYVQEIHIKSGTYTLTSLINLTGGKEAAFYGYGTTPMDGGTRPLITTATNSTDLFRSAGNPQFCSFSNINFSNTASTRAAGIASNTGEILCSDCMFDGFTVGVDGSAPSSSYGVTLSGCEIKNCSTAGVRMSAGGDRWFSLDLHACNIHDNQINVTFTGNCGFFAAHTRITDATAEGVYCNTSENMINLSNCTVANNGTDGISFISGSRRLIRLLNNIIYGNGAYGIKHTFSGTNAAAYQPIQFKTNAFGSNASGNNSDSFMGTGVSPITLTADPFTNAAGGDYSLNSDSGGGALCRGAGTQ